MAAVTLGRK